MNEITIGHKETKTLVCYFNEKKVAYESIDLDMENLRTVYGFNGDLNNLHCFDGDENLIRWVKKQKNATGFLGEITKLQHLRAYAEKSGELEFFERNEKPSHKFLAYQEAYLAKASGKKKQTKGLIPGLGVPTVGWYYGSPFWGDTSQGVRPATRFIPYLVTFNNRISSFEIVGFIPRAFCTRAYYTGRQFWVWPPMQVWAMSFAGLWINNDTTSVF